ncbi:MAG TPA: hypothetical protein VFD51_00715 [Patescibacteria group bacterium]|nr:hypothetical protein [Patescibacteria group bacterium]
METAQDTRERILRTLSDCLYHLYNPGLLNRLSHFKSLKRTYYDIKKEWIELHGIKHELFPPFQLDETNFNRIELLYKLDSELMRKEETGEPSYDMLSANGYFNIPQRRRKNKIIDLALSSQGISFEKLFPLKLRNLKKLIFK